MKELKRKDLKKKDLKNLKDLKKEGDTFKACLNIRQEIC